MKKKLFLFFLIILLCSGCRATYNLRINKDLSVTENLIAVEPKEFYKKYYKSSVSRVIDIVSSRAKDYIDKINYDTEKIYGEESGLKLTKTYLNLENYYKSSKLYTQLFDEFKHTDENNIVEFNLKGNITRESFVIEKYKVNTAEISIEIPFKVINSNADKHNKNTYTWIIDKKTDYKEIFIKFDKSKTVIDFTIFIVIGILFLVIGILIWFLNHFIKKTKRNNEI